MKLYTIVLAFFFLTATAEGASIPPVMCAKADPSFTHFLETFSEDKNFQRGRILVPLVVRQGDYFVNGAEVKLMSQPEIAKLPYSLFRSAKERKADYVSQSIALETSRYAEVLHDKDEADSDRVLYMFRNIEGCWFLEEFHDKSL
ncbi:MAG: hypothetical protein V4443_09145 [Pseudomonadota bacterium]